MIFLGELICILVIHLASKTPSLLDRSMLEAVQPHYGDSGNDWIVPRTATLSWSAVWFILPSACDLVATTLMNLGLTYTTASVFQMVRSSIMGFSAIFSFLFLSRRFLPHEWVSVTVILVGTGIIAWSATLAGEWRGALYLMIAQLFVAAQFILEEYLMDRYHLDPVRAMSIEGVFGAVLFCTALLLAALFGTGVFDVKTGFSELLDDYVLWQSALVLALMVAIFNIFGLAISTAVGVAGRSVIDAFRIVLIWIVGVHYGWDNFSWYEFGGFTLLVLGIFMFNGVFASLRTAVVNRGRGAESAPLLS
ncbi:uncharacterized protein BYT42DRAFT_558197 [Radiomyces spectabilis]|uniref:uncharacterized protein n=1 Tax=Radiomyces spectabilis TaxID=64574 RepID=UPI002220B988|nr:uncharacterized protein BYT42DRAFT_558197 [Radiomyces spectabilis]KAI8391823.1 hypothetical protein BYT42DRAFT_558197 [Radiomyces spectabilis]